MKKKFSRFLAALVLLAATVDALAAGCNMLTAENIAWLTEQGKIARAHSSFPISFSSGMVDVDPNLEIGGLIAEAKSIPSEELHFIWCSAPSGNVHFALNSSPLPSELGNSIYETGVPGVGFRITQVRQSGSIGAIPRDTPWIEEKPDQDSSLNFGAGTVFRIELIKTSEALPSESTISLGNLSRVYGDDNKTVVDFNAGSVKLRVLPICHVDQQEKNVDFGQFGPKDVSFDSGPTKDVKFDVQCSGPTPPVSITATLAATPDSHDQSLIANAGDAMNLAIRLRDASTQQVLRPNDPTSEIKVEPGGAMEHGFALEATVLRVGTAPPTAGTIDATSIITLTIL